MSKDVKGTRQYLDFLRDMKERGPQAMGPMTSWTWYDDPRRLAFMLARYKFVAKMLEGTERVLEVGCGDGFGCRIVAQAVGSVTALDLEPEFIEAARSLTGDRFPIRFETHDMLAGPYEGQFGGLYSLDVLEHIEPAAEDRFLTNMLASLSDDGAAIIGMPSLESQEYASEYSRMGHINCKEQPAFKELMKRFFRNVFMFSMNDELVHTGYSKMAHYNIALCCGKRVS